jgi:hypothetical protein
VYRRVCPDDAGGFQVAVDHSGGVDRLQRLGDPGRQREHLVGGQRPPFTDGVLEGWPGSVGRGEPGFLGLQVRRDDGHGVETLDPPSRRDLQREALAEAGSAAYARWMTLTATALPAGVRPR